MYNNYELGSFKESIIDGLSKLATDYNIENLNQSEWDDKTINKTIEELMVVEDKMLKDDKENFESLCTMVLELDSVKDLKRGNMVLYEGDPYMISEIDIDGSEISVLLWDGDDEDNGFYVSPTDITKNDKK